MPRSWAQLLGEENAQPEAAAERAGLFSRLRDSLSKSRQALTAEIAVRRVRSGRRRGVGAARGGAHPRRRRRARDGRARAAARGAPDLTDLNAALAEEIATLLGEPPTLDVHADPTRLPHRRRQRHGQDDDDRQARRASARSTATPSSLGAADTFRAAAEEQLEIWAERASAEFVGAERGADPASVAYDAIEAATRDGRDVVIVDTAGRLHTQTNLMEELAKVRRVIEGKLEGAPHETLLVVDATTGQNGLQQARLFGEAVGVTGVVLTKLDGSAKGGIAVAIAHELGLPVKLIGVGERLEDLRPFDADDFARALVSG